MWIPVQVTIYHRRPSWPIWSLWYIIACTRIRALHNIFWEGVLCAILLFSLVWSRYYTRLNNSIYLTRTAAQKQRQSGEPLAFFNCSLLSFTSWLLKAKQFSNCVYFLQSDGSEAAKHDEFGEPGDRVRAHTAPLPGNRPPDRAACRQVRERTHWDHDLTSSRPVWLIQGTPFILPAAKVL